MKHRIKYHHVDVFTPVPLAGNGLTVVFPEEEIDSQIMLKIAQEFKQFETIFIFPEEDGCYPVRIFTVEEELDFAGHPIIGAAAVIHHLYRHSSTAGDIRLKIGKRLLSLSSKEKNGSYIITMNQGPASLLKTLSEKDCKAILSASELTANDLYPGYPLEVVSTGLPYLLIPLKDAIERVKISVSNFEELLSEVDAKFAYFFDPDELECRTWDNFGLVEDVATGSAAGPLCAYLVNNGIKSVNEKIRIKQGRFVNRESVITGWITDETSEVIIEGQVALFGHGEISILA